jgi:hypothetical protein
MKESFTWAATHPQSVRPLNKPLLSLTIGILEFFHPVQKALALLRLAPRQNEIILIVPEGAWSILEETLQMDAVSPAFAANLRRDIAMALKAVQEIHLNEVRDVQDL